MILLSRFDFSEKCVLNFGHFEFPTTRMLRSDWLKLRHQVSIDIVTQT